MKSGSGQISWITVHQSEKLVHSWIETLGWKFQESFGLKFLIVQEKFRLFLQGSGSGTGRKKRIRIRQKSNFLMN